MCSGLAVNRSTWLPRQHSLPAEEPLSGTSELRTLLLRHFLIMMRSFSTQLPQKFPKKACFRYWGFNSSEQCNMDETQLDFLHLEFVSILKPILPFIQTEPCKVLTWTHQHENQTTTPRAAKRKGSSIRPWCFCAEGRAASYFIITYQSSDSDLTINRTVTYSWEVRWNSTKIMANF